MESLSLKPPWLVVIISTESCRTSSGKYCSRFQGRHAGGVRRRAEGVACLKMLIRRTDSFAAEVLRVEESEFFDESLLKQRR